MPSISLIRLCVATMFIAFAAASAQAAEPVWQLIVKRVPVPAVATSTAKAVPATQPSSETPTLTARISFVPDTPVDAEIQMNNKTFRLSALVTESRGGHFRIKIDVGATEHDQSATESSNIQSATIITSLESVSTTASLREGEEHSLGGNSAAQWLIKIEKKPVQK